MIKKLNSLFWIFWSIVIIFSLTESATYIGFWEKHLRLDYALLLLPTVFLGILLAFLITNPGGKKYLRGKNVYIKCFIVLATFFVILKIVNRFTYPNFVFSIIHIQPDNILRSVLIALIPGIFLYLPQVSSRKDIKSSKTLLLAAAFLVIAFNIVRIYKNENRSFIYILKNPLASYDEKMEMKVGSVFYKLTQFIISQTSENSTILMPPQGFPWPQSGNGAYLRYFIYPRKVGNGLESESPGLDTLSKIDYVILNWGETDSTEPPYTHGWPKFDVPAEKIIFMNEDGAFAGEIEEDYVYENYKDKKVWGLIKVKH